MPKLSSNQQIGDNLSSPQGIVVDVRNCEKYAVQLIYSTGSLTNTAKLQASLDYSPDTGDGTWTDIEGSDQTLDNTGGVHIWNVVNAVYPWLKIVTAGNTIAIDVWCAKDDQPRRG